MTNQIETTEDQKELITVCDKCLKASCWHGIFMCDHSQFAGTVEKTREELIKLGREHPDYITNNPKPLW